MKKLILIACVILSGCSTVTVNNVGSHKEIQYTNSGAPHQKNGAAYSLASTTMRMDIEAMTQCPNGYTVLKKRFDVEKQALTWDINCF